MRKVSHKGKQNKVFIVRTWFSDITEEADSDEEEEESDSVQELKVMLLFSFSF